MKLVTTLLVAASMLLGACASAPNPVTDQTYYGGKLDVVPPILSPRPPPRPDHTAEVRDPCRIWNVRTPPASIFDECGGSEFPVSIPDPGVDPEDPVDPKDPEDPVDPKDPEDPVDPVDPKDPHEGCRGNCNGNASANNGKGGNYDWTGHEDNGKGQGQGRR